MPAVRATAARMLRRKTGGLCGFSREIDRRLTHVKRHGGTGTRLHAIVL
jgi:hypothetical protein